MDDYPRKLRAAVKLAARIFNGRRMFYSEREIDDLVGLLKVCRSLPSLDHDVVAVIDILLLNLLSSEFNQLVSTMADRREMDLFIRHLFERVCDEGERTQAVARAIQWQRESVADWISVKHAVEVAFSRNTSVLTHKVALLRKTFVPENEEAAYSLHERAKGNEVLFQRERAGEQVYREPEPLCRPDIAMVGSDLHAFRDRLDRAASVKDLIRSGVITVNFTRVHGFYLGAALLADGRKGAVEGLVSEINRLWDEVTQGDGHAHHWSEPQCSWCGLIEPQDTEKKASLMLELECRALREKYVRAKGSDALPTFTLIQPAKVEAQRKEHHYA